MPDRPTLESLEARLDRIEAVLVNRIPPVIDPPPYDYGRWLGPFHWPR